MLQKIILQLNENDYTLLTLQMEESKADKYLALLTNYRSEKITDQELITLLDVKPSAFYTLKSRLSDKVQLFLYENATETRNKLIQNVAKIDHLVFNTPRETSIQILKKIEMELIVNDMPNELIIVYKALKKLHLHSQKHFDYSQLYNKHITHYLAQDKAEDLLSSFCKLLSEYYLSRDEQELNKLVLLRAEMEKICKRYQSHRLQTYKNILNIHFALFLPDEVKANDDITIESMLNETLEILITFGEDKVYKHLFQVINFLYFEYYHQLKLNKNTRIYYDKIVDSTGSLQLCDHSCFASHFLISKIEYSIENIEQSGFYSKNIIPEVEPDIKNVPSVILFNYSKATVAFYEERYSDALQILNKIVREISFKNSWFCELEIKLFLSMLYFFNKEEAHATVILKNLIRKINLEKENKKYYHASLFIKFLKSIGKRPRISKSENSAALYHHFNATNSGQYKILEFLTLNDEILAKIR